MFLKIKDPISHDTSGEPETFPNRCRIIPSVLEYNEKGEDSDPVSPDTSGEPETFPNRYRIIPSVLEYNLKGEDSDPIRTRT